MEPHVKMHHLFHNLLRKLFIVIGHDIYRGSVFKPYGLTFVMYGLLLYFFTGVIKTAAFYDAEVILNMIPLVGLVLEVTYSFTLLNFIFDVRSAFI